MISRRGFLLRAAAGIFVPQLIKPEPKVFRMGGIQTCGPLTLLGYPIYIVSENDVFIPLKTWDQVVVSRRSKKLEQGRFELPTIFHSMNF